AVGADAGAGADQRVYVYGIVPSDVETMSDARGVGEPPAEVFVVRHGDIAALVSRIDPDTSLGAPEDLAAHEALLDAAVTESPVLPVRFGAVMTGEDVVADELLAAYHDEFAAALDELEGKAEFVVQGRYDLDAVLHEIFDKDTEVARLREVIRGKPETATRRERVAIGERVSNIITARQNADTQMVVKALTDLGAPVTIRAPTHDEDALHVACLIELADRPELESRIDQIARTWSGRVSVRLLGPFAPYDFVTTTRE
ncbi:GvpL/GvpF family gas vesicle protein, partial [Actinophytocola sp.]|uniref:GvpL/GvpF family gas vesicle protein n=1 Tax=Actinophytocola sp. TaxID=1872138 RepID=UPI002ED37AF8